jgi:hypothetical protein
MAMCARFATDGIDGAKHVTTIVETKIETK